jgi:hypothetical protein
MASCNAQLSWLAVPPPISHFHWNIFQVSTALFEGEKNGSEFNARFGGTPVPAVVHVPGCRPLFRRECPLSIDVPRVFRGFDRCVFEVQALGRAGAVTARITNQVRRKWK